MFVVSSVSRCYYNYTEAERVLAEGHGWLDQKAQAACWESRCWLVFSAASSERGMECHWKSRHCGGTV